MWVWSSGALGGDKSSEERQQGVGIRPRVLHQSVSPASGDLGWAPGGVPGTSATLSNAVR